MTENSFQTWRAALGVIHDEMDRFIKSGWPETVQDRQVRRIQYVALIERRDAAARDCELEGGETKRDPDVAQLYAELARQWRKMADQIEAIRC